MSNNTFRLSLKLAPANRVNSLLLDQDHLSGRGTSNAELSSILSLQRRQGSDCRRPGSRVRAWFPGRFLYARSYEGQAMGAEHAYRSETVTQTPRQPGQAARERWSQGDAPRGHVTAGKELFNFPFPDAPGVAIRGIVHEEVVPENRA